MSVIIRWALPSMCQASQDESGPNQSVKWPYEPESLLKQLSILFSFLFFFFFWGGGGVKTHASCFLT